MSLVLLVDIFVLTRVILSDLVSKHSQLCHYFRFPVVSKWLCTDVLETISLYIVHYCSKNNVSNTTKMWLEHLHQNLYQGSRIIKNILKFYFESFFHIGGIHYAEGIDRFLMMTVFHIRKWQNFISSGWRYYTCWNGIICFCCNGISNYQ